MGVKFRLLSDGRYDPDQFDMISVSCADIHGVSRGRFVLRSSFPGVVKSGLGMTKAALLCGIEANIPVGLTDLDQEGWSSGIQMPDMTTLRPLSWLSTEKWKVGSIICDFDDTAGKRIVTSSREVTQIQLRALRALGFEPMVSAEAECTIFYKSTITPVPLHENVSPLLSELTQAFDQSGIPVLSVGLGLEPGKLQVNMKEQPALTLADNLFRFHGAVRSICGRSGYDVTFMTKSLPGLSSNRTQYSWRLLDREKRNVFSKTEESAEPSDLCRHWLAGQLEHTPATCALALPTVNCYREDRKPVQEGMESGHPIKTAWTTDQMNGACRIKLIPEVGLRLQDTIASSASNPYFVVAAVVAAGIDGLNNKMDLTLSDGEPAVKGTPQNLENALESLENDDFMRHQLGALFIERFLYLKKDFEIQRLKKNSVSEENPDNNTERLYKEDRAVYFLSL